MAGDAELIPFCDKYSTVITARMIMEHIARANGLFVFHTTNLANYNIRLAALLPQWLKTKIISILEARRESDVFPTACALNTSPHRGDSTAL